MHHTITVKTAERTTFIDITGEVLKTVKGSGVQSGMCIVYVPHTTAAVTINENADPDVVLDMLKEINKVIPFQDAYRHMEGNSAAHIKSSLFGVSQTIPIINGHLSLGTWQGIYFCEFDGPRTRKAIIKIISD